MPASRGRRRAAGSRGRGQRARGGERLRDVVVRAELEAEYPVDLTGSGREHQHRDVRGAAGAHPATDLHAVDRPREPDIEDHQHGLLVADRAESRFAVSCLDHPEAGVTEIQIEQIGDVGVVLDDDDRLLSCHPLAHVIVLASHLTGFHVGGFHVEGRRNREARGSKRESATSWRTR